MPDRRHAGDGGGKPFARLPAFQLAAALPAKVDVLADNLENPWSLAFLPDNQGMLITLRGGELKRWQPGKGLSAAISGVPTVWHQGQGGLLDVVL
ncbi:PQQ-dependent sugar dehydrogenase, partial [Cronobacter sakazakii]|uniref:PQQ-dependent sugar dehydrogenase n=1 Tax=Cronobacter sakazakii TaxID=28141 RepID=UPI003F6DD956